MLTISLIIIFCAHFVFNYSIMVCHLVLGATTSRLILGSVFIPSHQYIHGFAFYTLIFNAVLIN